MGVLFTLSHAHTCCGGVLTFRNAAGVVGDTRFGPTVTPAIASSTANCRPLESTVCSRPLQACTRVTAQCVGEHALERQTASIGAKHHRRLACHDQCAAGTEADDKRIVDENRVVVLLYGMCKQSRVHTASVVINDLNRVGSVDGNMHLLQMIRRCRR
jgi:hypothetical protein